MSHRLIKLSKFCHREANQLVEEFMLLANISAATAVATAFPDRALLRRHPQPNPRKLAAAASAAKEAGARSFDISTIFCLCTFGYMVMRFM